MPDRRDFLLRLVATGLLPALPALSDSAAAGFAGDPLAGLDIRRCGEGFLVNGWVLTARDLQALADHAR